MCVKRCSLMRIFYTVAAVYNCFVCLLLVYSMLASEAHPSTTRREITGILEKTAAVVNKSTIAVNKTTLRDELTLNDRKPPKTEREIYDSIANWKNVTTVPLFSDDVINPHPFNFTITNQDACSRRNETSELEVFLVILVKCRPNETYDRQQIRRTWGGVKQVIGRQIVTMFLVGQTTNETTNRIMENEDNEYHDFIQEDFMDAYYNMTYKNIMGLKWVTLFCPRAGYVLSIDSDMILNIYNLVLRLIQVPPSNFAEGNLRRDPLPHRHRSSKWYTPFEVYPEPTYAPFLNGACYVMSGDVAIAVFRKSVHVRFLQWDDVFVGLVMKRIGVQPKMCSLYEQFLTTRIALKVGIAKGVRHNVHRVNENTIRIWNKVVGKHLRDDNLKIPRFVWVIVMCVICFIFATLAGCGIHILFSFKMEIETESNFENADELWA